MAFHQSQNQTNWHSNQWHNAIVPQSPSGLQKRSYFDAFPQDFCVDASPNAYYPYDSFAMHSQVSAPLERAQTFADMNDFYFAYENECYAQGSISPNSCAADDLGYTDDVASCFSETASSYISSDFNDGSSFNSIRSTARNLSVTSQPSTITSQPSTEVDSLMKSLQPTSSYSTPTTSAPTKTKRHICPHSDCAKSFSQPTHLKIHLRSHTGEKPYVCSVPTCRQSFSQLGNLRTHERRHVGQRPNRKRAASDPGIRNQKYECKLDGCRDSSGHSGKVFTQLGNLKAHMNKFHKETLARLSEQFTYESTSPEEAELKSYFQDLYKNCNKGIKGRGKGRKVEVIVESPIA